MGCHLTLAITRSSHDLLSHVKKNIGTSYPQPHPQHPLWLAPSKNRTTGENNSHAGDGFSVFSSLMTCLLPNSSAFHPCQSRERELQMIVRRGKKSESCISINHNSLMQAGTFNCICFYFGSVAWWFFYVILMRSESSVMCDYFLLLCSGFWQGLTPTSTVSLYQTSRKPKKWKQASNYVQNDKLFLAALWN